MQNNDIKTQAELRRKKILANAEARLKKISGKAFEKVDISKVPEENEVELKPTNGSLCNGSHIKKEETSLEDLNHSAADFLTGHEELLRKVDFLSNDVTPQQSEQERQKTFKLDCYIFLALGIFVRYLFCLELSWLFLNNILGPFIVASIPRISTILSRDVQPTGVMGLVSLLVANQRKYRLLFKAIYALRTVSQLFALYLFSFTVGHLIMADKNS